MDHPVVQAMVGRINDRRIVTYGFSPQADVRAIDLAIDPAGASYDVVIAGRGETADRRIPDLRLPMMGQHNVQNSLAAIAVASEMGAEDDTIRSALASFGGVKRRFTRTGEVDGITVIDDYGHHPVEIAAVLRAARAATRGRVIAVVQPHRYTRLANLFEEFCTCFNDADRVIVAEVYAAGEAPIAGINRDALVQGLIGHGHRHVLPLAAPSELAALIDRVAQRGDLVVCLGAGNITQWAQALPAELAARRRRAVGGAR
jgi:UDP-N-acetylmuramate--alanine ligase